MTWRKPFLELQKHFPGATSPWSVFFSTPERPALRRRDKLDVDPVDLKSFFLLRMMGCWIFQNGIKIVDLRFTEDRDDRKS
jgi:hypothetical protein